MFKSLVLSRYSFLEEDFKFTPCVVDERCIKYKKNETVLRFTYSNLDEVGLSVYLPYQEKETWVGIGFIVALTDPKVGLALRDKITSKNDEIDKILADIEDLLMKYGIRLLNNDITIFEDIKKYINEYWQSHKDTQTRQLAEIAFRKKDYSEAMKLYRLLGERRTLLDNKRMEISVGLTH